MNEVALNTEQIIREVTPIGNGAHIFAPKEWVGEKIVLVRTPKLPLKKRILKILEPYLENILGIYIYGSHARGEQKQDSDIDVLVISSKIFKIKVKGFEIIVLEKQKIKEAIKIAPVLIYSALAEAKPIINSELLAELKKNFSPKAGDFKEYIKETKNITKINEEFFSPYSIILRLRGIYIIEKLLSKKECSYEDFKKWVIKDAENADVRENFDNLYLAYIKIKNNFRASVKESYLKDFLLILKNKTKKLERKLNV